MNRFRNRWLRPHGVGGRLLLTLVLLRPGVLWAEHSVHCSTNYYPITGSTLREMQEAIRRNRPAHVDREALTEWNVRVRFGVVGFQDAYRCGGFTTLTTIRITLPRWTPPEGVSESVSGAWDRYIKALRGHEEGHARFALAAAAEMHRRVAALGTESDPTSLKWRVDGIVVETLEEFHKREREYDRLTGHGLEQGATLAAGRDGSGLESESPARRDRGRWEGRPDH